MCAGARLFPPPRAVNSPIADTDRRDEPTGRSDALATLTLL